MVPTSARTSGRYWQRSSSLTSKHHGTSGAYRQPHQRGKATRVVPKDDGTQRAPGARSRWHWPRNPSKVPVELVDRLYRYRAAQDQKQWPSSRRETARTALARQRKPPAGVLLMRVADDAGVDLEGALLRLGTFAWMEGHVEGYDRAMTERLQPFYYPTGYLPQGNIITPAAVPDHATAVAETTSRPRLWSVRPCGRERPGQRRRCPDRGTDENPVIVLARSESTLRSGPTVAVQHKTRGSGPLPGPFNSQYLSAFLRLLRPRPPRALVPHWFLATVLSRGGSRPHRPNLGRGYGGGGPPEDIAAPRASWGLVA